MITHYTAVLKIIRTEDTEKVVDRYGVESVKAGRTTDETLSIVVRASTMESLQAKLQAHIALANEN